VLWGGAEVKAFACLQADDGDAFGCRFSPWRHQSFALSPSVPPWLVAWSVVHPVYLPCFILHTVALEALAAVDCLQMVVRWPWRMLCRRDRVVWWMLCHSWVLRVWRMLCRFSSTLADVLPLWSCYSVDVWPPSRASCLLSLGIFGDSISCKSCSSGGLCLGGLFGVSSPFVLFLLSPVLLVATAISYVCLYFFFSVSLSLVLRVLVLAKSCFAAISLCL